MLRAILDANILISSFVGPGICRTLVKSLDEDKFTLVTSPALIEDFLRAVEKPKLKRLIPSSLLDDVILLIHSKAIIVEPKVRIRACRDPADDAVLEAALAAKANIVTGDKDLLSMTSLKNIIIHTPRAFASKLGLI